MKYGFIGVGNMGGAILRGLLHAGALNPEDVMVAGRTPERSAEQAQDFGVRAAGSRAELTASCDVIFVGVEPGTFPEILSEIAENLTQDKLLISMAAGITLDRIEETLGCDAKLIRIMPNTPAGVGEIMVSVSRNGNVSDAETEHCKSAEQHRKGRRGAGGADPCSDRCQRIQSRVYIYVYSGACRGRRKGRDECL